MAQSTPINMIRRGDQTNMPPPMDASMQMQNMHSMMDMQNGGGADMGAMSGMGGSPGSDSQLVEDILKEMGESPGAENQSNINSQALHYAMDSSQVPPNKYIPPPQQHQQYQQQHQQAMEMQNEYTNQLMNKNAPNGLLSQMGINLNSENLRDKIINNIKYPLLVFAISFLISLPEFNRFLFGFFPRLLLESGQVSLGGVLLKALLGALLYGIVALFL